MTSKIHIEKTDLSSPMPSWEEAFPRQHFVVFDAVLQAGQSGVATAQVYAPFKGHRLAVDPTTAAAFRVSGIKIGNSLFGIRNGSLHGASGTLFPPSPRDLSVQEREDFDALQLLDLPTCTSSEIIVLEIENVSNETKNFNAILWGLAVKSKG